MCSSDLCGSGLRACSSPGRRLHWSSRLRTLTAPLLLPSSPQGTSSASGPVSRSGAGDNPLPPSALGLQSFGKSPLGLRPLLGPLPPRLLQPQHPRPLGPGLQRPVLLARSTPSPPKLRPLPKARRPVKRLDSPLVPECFRVHWCKCPPVIPPSPSHLLPYQ